MIIGTFKKDEDGSHFTGFIPCLSMDRIAIEPVQKDEPPSGKGIDWQLVFCGLYDRAKRPAPPEVELGAAWNRRTPTGMGYLSVKIDSPTLQAPINCALFHVADDRYHLVWNRDDRKAAKQA